MTDKTMADLVSAKIEESGRSGREIERLAGLPTGTLYNITAGKNLNPKVGTLAGLAQVFGCKPWDLVPGNDAGTVTGGDLAFLDADQIDVTCNPRTVFADDTLHDLAESIFRHGILTPVIVRPGAAPDRFILVAGERRLRAVALLAKDKRWGNDGEKIPARIVEDIDEGEHLELALIENIQRENLSVSEEARAYRLLREQYDLSNREIAIRVGKSARHIDYCMAFLDLHPAAVKAIEDGTLAFATVRHLSRLTGTQQQAVVDQIGAGTLAPTLAAVQHRVGMILSTPKANRSTPDDGEQMDIEDPPAARPVISRLLALLPGCERVFTYQATDNRCEAAIDMLEVQPDDIRGGWVGGFQVSFQVGDHGVTCCGPRKDDPKYPDRRRAICHAAREIARVASDTYTSTSSVVTDTQRREARKLLLWANALLNEHHQEGEPVPESSQGGGRLAGNKTTVNRGGGPTNEEIARDAAAAFVPPDPEPRLRVHTLPDGVTLPVDTRPGATNFIDPRTGEKVAPAGIEDEPDEPDNDQIGDDDEPAALRGYRIVSAVYPPEAAGCALPTRVDVYDPATKSRATYTRSNTP